MNARIRERLNTHRTHRTHRKTASWLRKHEAATVSHPPQLRWITHRSAAGDLRNHDQGYTNQKALLPIRYPPQTHRNPPQISGDIGAGHSVFAVGAVGAVDDSRAHGDDPGPSGDITCLAAFPGLAPL